MVKLAMQVASRPDGSTPEQTESWGDCKAAYRLFDSGDVTFAEIIAPHCRQTRAACVPGDVKLIVCDTTEIDYGPRRRVRGLGPTGNGSGQGFFLHTAMMLDATDGRIDGMAGQRLFYRRQKPKKKKKAKNTVRRSSQRESVVWGELIDDVGPPPAGVRWLHVCDRGADDFEVFRRADAQRCGWVIRAARLNRKVLSADGRRLTLDALLREQPEHGTKPIRVLANGTTAARTATVALRFAPVSMPCPKVLTPWLREHRSDTPLSLWVVELREVQPPPGVTPLRWVLYTSEPATTVAEAHAIIGHYERRPTIEDYHKGLKTGCRVEDRFYETAARLERVTGVLSVVAMRLLQLKTAARETPNRPAREVAPARWVTLLQRAKNKPVNPDITLRDFIRQLAGLGGHLGRKGDGEPGWITLWRGFEKLMLLVRGADAQLNKCG